MMSISAMLTAKGICGLPDAYDSGEIAAINSAVAHLLGERTAERRSYVHVDELQQLGILPVILGARMKELLFSLMPDPVLYHCFVIETAGNDLEPNLFATALAGWHRDADCAYVRDQVTHASVFVYLTPVADDDGAFEFLPQDPTVWLRSTTPSILVKGDVGHTFAWQRSYFHRASPNRGPRRRRMVKISVQRNSYTSIHLSNDHFRRAIDATPSGDPATDLLFGRYQGRRPPSIDVPEPPNGSVVATNTTLSLPDVVLAKGQIRMKAAATKRYMSDLLGRAPALSSYD